MRSIAWAIGAALLGVAALSVYFSFQSPTFVAGLALLAASAAWKAVVPIVTKRMSPADEKAWHEAVRRGEDDEFRRRKSGFPPKG